MSSISYRTWEYWINKEFFDTQETYHGWFECIIAPTLMATQTVEFVIEQYEIRDFQFTSISPYPPQYKQQLMYTNENELCLKIYTSFDTTQDAKLAIDKVMDFLTTMSLSTDFPLICHKIRFVDANRGKLLVANRKSIGRGVGFEIEERGIASQKINSQFPEYLSLMQNDEYFKVGLRHYLTGMQLLSLEDQVSGLIDAAFMQFYQGCEALCQDPKGNLEPSKKFIAQKATSNVKELQIIAHQVWRVRNKYYGHGDKDFNLQANSNLSQMQQVAKQVLVVRYLCRVLLEIYTSSQQILTREMGLYFGENSNSFNGDIGSFASGQSFFVDYDIRDCKIFDSSGQPTLESPYTI